MASFPKSVRILRSLAESINKDVSLELKAHLMRENICLDCVAHSLDEIAEAIEDNDEDELS